MPILAIIIFGILSSCFALLFEMVILTFPLFSDDILYSFLPLSNGEVFTFGTFLALLGAALFEEVSKYLFLRQYAFRYIESVTLSTQEIFVLGTLFGMGFAIVELALIVGGSDPYSFLPLLGIALLHSITSLLFAFSLFRYSLSRRLFVLYCILAAIFLHMAYNIAILLFS